MSRWCAECGAGRRSMRHFEGEGMLCRGCYQFHERHAQRKAAEHINQELLV